MTETAPNPAEPPPLPPLTAEEQALVDAADALPPAEAALPTVGAGATQTAPAESAPDSIAAAPAVKRPAPGFGTAVEGVTVGRLPRIVPAAPADPVQPAADATGIAPDAQPDAAIPDDTAPAYVRFARAFENPASKPVFAILLQDTGGPDIDREALAALPFPVTFALDPTSPDAATAAAIYRRAGQEVVMLATGLPEGATAADIEVTFQEHGRALPEAVAVLDPATGGFQGNRALAAQVVEVIGGQGRGVLSWDRGLNAASQIARREGMQNAIVFRSLDAEGEAAPVIRRYLDRAAFKAAQDGRVVVAGLTRPETVTALLEWAVEGRAATVVLAPVTAAMTAQ